MQEIFNAIKALLESTITEKYWQKDHSCKFVEIIYYYGLVMTISAELRV